ncbi:MAG: hypothetical protein EOO59_16225 [Hymenobacter sp.]|nr:MAG: hypothetical protein EOO59_16225 [Hymenobacter sp.]
MLGEQRGTAVQQPVAARRVDRAAGKQPEGQATEGAADPVHPEGVEGVVVAPAGLEVHRRVAHPGGQRADAQGPHRGHKARRRGDADQAGHQAGDHPQHGDLAEAPGLHQPHDVTMACLGGGLLWFGWFGFNGGAALAADGLAALAVVNTHAAAAAGAAPPLKPNQPNHSSPPPRQAMVTSWGWWRLCG